MLFRTWELHRYLSQIPFFGQKYEKSYATCVILIDEASISKAVRHMIPALI